MVQTIFGTLMVKVDGIEREYCVNELPNFLRGRHIEKRYILHVEVEDFSKKLNCILEIRLLSNERFPKANIESGENLFAVSFTEGSKSLCIGVEGDIPGINYRSADDGIILDISADAPIKCVRIAVAWMYVDSPSDSILTWLAADPNYEG